MVWFDHLKPHRKPNQIWHWVVKQALARILLGFQITNKILITSCAIKRATQFPVFIIYGHAGANHQVAAAHPHRRQRPLGVLVVRATRHGLLFPRSDRGRFSLGLAAASSSAPRFPVEVDEACRPPRRCGFPGRLGQGVCPDEGVLHAARLRQEVESSSQ